MIQNSAIIKNVNFYYPTSSYIVLVEEARIRFLDSQSRAEILVLDTGVVWYSCMFNGIVLFQNINGESVKYVSPTDFKMHEILGQYILFKSFVFENKMLLPDINNQAVILDGELVISNQVISGRLPKDFVNDSFVRIIGSVLSISDSKTNVEHWRIDASKLGSYVNIFGKRELGKFERVLSYKTIIIAEITGIFLLGINSVNGDIVWKQHFDSNLFFSFSEYNGSLHIFSYGTYSQIDILTGELLQTKSLENDFKSIGFSVVGHTAPAVSEKYIVLASSFEAFAIIIDRSNLQIVQRVELSGNYVPQTNTPKFNDDQLYILDAHNNLHIFEDE